ncbi:RTA1-domain-containing protein [Coprinopsis marcescibilis]|uniref:RTA1-domain-containing protein n=1 Tax=Coprinopsis marcescibilis TaxID=230819 RepID=A0A5C3L2Z3_COPMA|nr:RTA1-domain-containing protein [Coprinopsis marcescibilis]
MSSDHEVSSSESGGHGYIPSQKSAIIFIAIFALSTIAHIVQLSKKRTWFMIQTIVLCGVLESVGWGGRLWMHYEPESGIAFNIQIVLLILGPTPLLAANFVIFGRIIRRLGQRYSRMRPRMYTIIFVSCDVISLGIQGAGGALAASADDLEGANKGAKIMLGGIVFQLVVIVVYSVLGLEYFVRFIQDRPIGRTASTALDEKALNPQGLVKRDQVRLTRKIKMMLFALVFTTVLLFIRAIYRTLELAEGWEGRIIQTELYFDVLDGAMIVLAIFTFNVAHPGWLLELSEEEQYKESFSSDDESA